MSKRAPFHATHWLSIPDGQRIKVRHVDDAIDFVEGAVAPEGGEQ